ncbi:MAG: carbon-nitrogen hydrolase family protein [Crenarchaeota archaeon]|nr:MAG: carbon-nitrogen hydrolase family protein [Thermoproteota archaeon]RDJ33877.1 MAG: carbon-nitrogen hydrolase family protein [Thermoproteota archaeon]RDJ37012.1 MAG: carbon-nitrogen hydrolase family protein [Thermoproteota archaeon]RDJ37453.1 MAG: carbon-nitrogen hydrolase family protein [Thermoproteota archaeon]
MVKLGIIQTGQISSNSAGICKIVQILLRLGKKETDIVCLPEQWLKNNNINDFEKEFLEFQRIAKDYSMTIIPGAFYEKIKNKLIISAPVIDPKGEIIGKQEKIHPFDYERRLIRPGDRAKIFKTSCKFGIVICYDMVFPKVVNSLARKGAEVIFSPSRIVKRGITPWHLYVQTRALENRIPIVAANVLNQKFGGKSIIVDLHEKSQVYLPKNKILNKPNSSVTQEFTLSKHKKSRASRFSDENKFS